MTEMNSRAARATYRVKEEKAEKKSGEKAKEASEENSEKKYKQMPEIQSTMTKDIFLGHKGDKVLKPTKFIPRNGKALVYHCGNDDVDGNLKKTLRCVGFDVEEGGNISSMTKTVVEEDLKALSKEAKADTVLLAITANGGRETAEDSWPGPQGQGSVRGLLARDVIHAKRREKLSMEEILKPFQESQALAGKPKIFLIQFCREVSHSIS